MDPEKFLPREIQAFIKEHGLQWQHTYTRCRSHLSERAYRFYSHPETATRICIILTFYRSHYSQPWEHQDTDILTPVTLSTDQGEMLKALGTYIK